MPKSFWLLLCCLLIVGCQRGPEAGRGVSGDAQRMAADGDHLVSVGSDEPVAAPIPAATPRRAASVIPAAAPKPTPAPIDGPWPEAQLELGKALISCDTDYASGQGEGAALPALDRDSLRQALAPCQQTGLLRVRYEGKINAGFAELAWRLAAVADELKLHRRILDLDSSGGQVEAAIRAGDAIGESNWTIWVREGSICHSACVFVLAAGDNRLIAGKVGIHRMMRISSKATSRAELNRELHEVYGRVKDYLERNGVAVAAADLMMTVPNRSLRLLTPEELKEYGLDGTNAVQDDLERIRQMRQCGDDFVRRKDAFLIAFDQECKSVGADLEAVNACGQNLKHRFGFPDPVCPEESPLAENDTALLLPSSAPADTTGVIVPPARR